MGDKKVIDFTKGSPAKQIMGFFWPLLLTSMFQQLYNFVDVMIVGKGIGDAALASVGNMGTLFFLIVGFSFGLAGGFGVLIAQSFGAKDEDGLRHRIAATIQLSAVLAVVLTCFSVLFLPHALRLLQTDEKLMEDCLTYGYILFGGLCVSICYNISASVLRALGDSRTPLRAIIFSSLVNLSLDVLFIFGFHMGVGGAAFATVIAQFVSIGICMKQLMGIEMIRLHASDFKNEKRVYLELIRNGLPMAFMNSITAVGCMVVQHYVNGYGISYTTAYSTCSRYLNLFMNPASTAGGAMSAYTGQNYGAKEYCRIKEGLKVCLSISFVSYIVLGSVMVFFPEFLAKMLISGEVPVQLVCQYLPICGMTIIAVDCLFVIRSGVQGMGHPVEPMWSGVLEMVVRIAIISIFMGTIGFRAAALAEVGAWVGALIVNVAAFCKILIPKLREEKIERLNMVASMEDRGKFCPVFSKAK